MCIDRTFKNLTQIKMRDPDLNDNYSILINSIIENYTDIPGVFEYYQLPILINSTREGGSHTWFTAFRYILKMYMQAFTKSPAYY